MGFSNDIIKQIFDIDVDEELVVIVLGIILFLFNYFYKENIFIVTNILISTFVISLYDVYIRKILLFNICDDYHKLIVNNIITIIVINFLSRIIRNYSDEKLNFLYYFNLAFACFFYETIVFKLYNYNDIYDKRLRSVAKTIMRLATIHILSSFLNDTDFDKEWFDFSFSQLVNFSLFNVAFVE
jgi:hypothetical protein